MVLKAVLGQESFLSYIPQSCASSQFFNLQTSTCDSCDPVCLTCYGPGSSECIEFACPEGQYYSSGSCVSCDPSCALTCTGPSSSECTTCSAQEYQSGPQCLQCDILCDGCTGPGNTNCLACAADKNLIQGTTTCVTSCVDYAPNYYDAGATCNICDSSCHNCSGPQEYECYSCAAGALEVLSSPSGSPKHCTSTCGPGYFPDSPYCRECATYCETCSGSIASDCTLCYSGYYLQTSPIQCTSTCPDGFFGNSATRVCQSCHSSCLTCSGPSTTECLSCDTGLSLQIDGSCLCSDGTYFSGLHSSCQPCSSLCQNCSSSATTCTSCPSPAILSSSQCVCPDSSLFSGSCPCSVTSADGECMFCGDGIVHLGETCDDGNQESSDGCSSTCQTEDAFNCNTSISPSHCAAISILQISEIAFESTVKGIKVTLKFSSKVKLIGFTASMIQVTHPFSSSTSVEVQDPGEQNISSLSFTINPKASISNQHNIDFSIDTSSIKPIDKNIVAPQKISQTPKLPSYDYVDPVVVDLATVLEHTLQSFTTASIPSAIVCQILMNISMEPLWIFINTNQLLFYIALIQVNLPANAIALFKILSFANGDLLLYVLLYENTVGHLIPQSSSQAFAPNFKLLGYESTSLIDNSGIFYSVLFLQLSVLLLLILCSKILNQAIGRGCLKCANKMLCSPLIRTFFQVYLEVMLCAGITIHKMNLSSSFEFASFFLASFTIIAGILLGALLIKITAQPTSELEDKNSSVSRRFYEAYSMLNVKRNFMALNYFTWFLFRRMIIIVTLLYLLKYPVIQIAIHILLAIIDLAILLRARPFLLKVDQCFNVFNSVFLLALYALVAVIHFSSHIVKMKETLGWIMIIGIAGINAVNILTLIIVKFVQIVTKCKERRKERRRQIEARYKLEVLKERNSGSLSLFQKVQPITSGQPLQDERHLPELQPEPAEAALRRVQKESNELKQIY